VLGLNSYPAVEAAVATVFAVASVVIATAVVPVAIMDATAASASAVTVAGTENDRWA
jgi:hypothetical protein